MIGIKDADVKEVK